MYVSVTSQADLTPPIINDVSVCNHKATALYDTGSSICLVSKDFLLTCNLSTSVKPPSLAILSVTGTPLDIIGEIVLPLTILGKTIDQKFYISEKPLSFHCDLIVGIDFIIYHRLIYNPVSKLVSFLHNVAASSEIPTAVKTTNRLSPKRRKRVRFLLTTNDQPVSDPLNQLCTENESQAYIIDSDNSCSLFACTNTEVPPFSELFVKMKCPRNFTPTDKSYTIQGHPDQSLNGLHVARAITFLDNSHVFVRVANVTSVPILIRKNLRIAQLCASTDHLDSVPPTVDSDTFSAATESEQHSKIGPDDFKLDHIPEPYRSQLRTMLMKHVSAFGTKLEDIKGTNVYEHHIELTDDTPAFKPAYRLPFAHRSVVKSEIDKLLASGIIEPAISPYNAPIILVKKANGGHRLVSDLRLLNQKIKDDRYPNSFALDAIDQMAGCTIFTTLDLLSSFHQIPLAESSRPYTAFTANNLHMQYQRIPFGLKTSSQGLSRALQIALSGLQNDQIMTYVDDIIIGSKTYSEHLTKLDKVLHRLEETKFILRPSKCNFMQRQIQYLGHIIDEYGVRPDPSKVQAVSDFPRPKTVKDVRSFLGFANYYRRHVPRMSDLAAPLSNLTRKDVPFIWTDQCERAFQSIKKSLVHYPVLRFPDFSKDFILSTDASQFAVSAVLEQQYGSKLHPVAFISRRLNSAETRYSTTEREALAIFWAFENLKCYLTGHFTHVITDHLPLRSIFKATNPGGRLTRWALKLSNYDFDIQYRKGKDNILADTLSRQISETQTKNDFLGYVSATAFEEDGWTRSKIKTEQRKDPALIPIIDCLSGNARRHNKDLQLHEQLSNYFLSSDGLLYHVASQKNKTRPFIDQLVVPTPMQKLIIQKYHDTIWSGHLKFEKTLQKIRLSFFWKHMYTDVKQYVQSCRPCMERHAHKTIKPAPLQRTLTPEYPMHIASFDIVGPLKTSYRGNTHYLSWIDHFSRFPEAIPISETNTEAVAKAFVEHIISRYGISKILLSDRGSNFTSKLMQSICKLLGVKRILSSPRHPQANGRVERIHSVIGNILSHFVDPSQRNWDEVLPLALFAIRSTVNRSTGDTPAQIFTGRDLILPFEVDTQVPFDPFTTINSYRDVLHKHLSALHKIVRANNEAAILAQERFHPTQSDDPTFPEGSLVYLHNPQFKSGLTRKLQKINRGPYRVLQMTSPVNVRIQHLSNPNDVQLVHVNRLKKFVELDDTTPKPSDGAQTTRSSVGEALIGDNTAAQPITSLAEPGIPNRQHQDDDLLQEGDLAFLAVPHDEPPVNNGQRGRIDHPASALRPKNRLKQPDRWGYPDWRK